MQIDRLRLEHFKGVVVEEKLARLNIFIGPNGSGKTARLMAPRYAITGTTTVGARPADVMKLAPPGVACGVGVILDDGFGWGRTATADATTGRITTAMEVTPQPLIHRSGGGAGGLVAMQAEVWSHVGNFAPTFDVGAFTGLSPDRKRDLVLGLCATARSSGDPWLAKPMATRMSILYCKQVLGDATVNAHIEGFDRQFKADDPTKMMPESGMNPVRRSADDRDEALLCFLITKLGEAERLSLGVIAEAVGDAIGMIVVEDELGRIAKALKTAKELANGARTTARECIEAARRLNERKGELVVSARSVPDLEDHAKLATDKREALLRDIGEAKGRAQAQQAFDETIKLAGQLAEGATFKLRQLGELDPDPEAKRLEGLRICRDEAQKIVDGAEQLKMPYSADDVQDARQAVQTAELRHQNAATEFTSLDSERAIAEASLEAFDATPIERIWEMLVAAGVVVACLTPAAKDAWNKLVDYVANQRTAGVRKETADRIAACEARLEGRTAAEHELDVRVMEATGRLDRIVDARSAVAAQSQDAAVIVNKAAADVVEATAAITTIERAVDAEKRAESDARDELAKAERMGADADAGLQTLLGETGGIDVDEATDLEQALLRDIQGAQTQIEAKNTYQNIERELGVCIERGERKQALFQAATKYANGIRVVREERIKLATDPLLKLMGEFLETAKPGVIPTLELEEKEFTLGWLVARTGHVVPIESLSAGETAVYCAALLYALVALANPPLKLLIMEIGEVDREHFDRLLDAFEKTPGDFQVMIATHDALTFTRYDAWNLRRLENPASAAPGQMGLEGAAK